MIVLVTLEMDAGVAQRVSQAIAVHAAGICRQVSTAGDTFVSDTRRRDVTRIRIILYYRRLYSRNKFVTNCNCVFIVLYYLENIQC